MTGGTLAHITLINALFMNDAGGSPYSARFNVDVKVQLWR